MKVRISFLFVCLSVFVLGDRSVLASPLNQEEIFSNIQSSSDIYTARSVEPFFSLEFPSLLLDDSKAVFSKPYYWDCSDWMYFGTATASVVGLAALDKPIRNEFIRSDSEPKHDVARVFSRFGAEYLFGIVGAFEVGGIAAGDDNAIATAHDAIIAIGLANGVATTSLKFASGRRRPTEYGDDYVFKPFSGNMSFPSGHTTQAFAAAAVISEHYDSLWAQFISYGLASMVGVSMVQLDSHYASDVLAGGLIGTVIGKSVAIFNRTHKYRIGVSADTNQAQLQLSMQF